MKKVVYEICGQDEGAEIWELNASIHLGSKAIPNIFIGHSRPIKNVLSDPYFLTCLWGYFQSAEESNSVRVMVRKVS